VTRFSIIVAFVLACLVAGSSAQESAPSPQQASPAQQPANTAQQPANTAPQAPAPSPPSTAADRQRPSFRSGIDIVSLNVTVTDASSHYVTDLAEGDFSVFEDGVKQSITFFSRRQQPIALSLLLDSSASMEQHLGTLQTAATNFIKKMKPNDIAQVIDFDSRVEIRQGFTGNQSDLQGAIEHTNAGGSTSLHNAIYIALKELRKVKAVSEEDVRRQALIVFSDGEDTSSLVSFEEVLDLAKRSETAIYAIGLRPAGAYRTEFKEAEFVLKQLSQETGGRAYFVTTASELPKIYQQISDELANQYSMAYSSRNPMRNGAWRRIVVRVSKPGLAARTRQGYYGPETGR